MFNIKTSRILCDAKNFICALLVLHGADIFQIEFCSNGKTAASEKVLFDV
jgi:hypothetical protein